MNTYDIDSVSDEIRLAAYDALREQGLIVIIPAEKVLYGPVDVGPFGTIMTGADIVGVAFQCHADMGNATSDFYVNVDNVGVGKSYSTNREDVINKTSVEEMLEEWHDSVYDPTKTENDYKSDLDYIEWSYKWKWFRPPNWFIFKWAYNIKRTKYTGVYPIACNMSDELHNKGDS